MPTARGIFSPAGRSFQPIDRPPRRHFNRGVRSPELHFQIRPALENPGAESSKVFRSSLTQGLDKLGGSVGFTDAPALAIAEVEIDWIGSQIFAGCCAVMVW